MPPAGTGLAQIPDAFDVNGSILSSGLVAGGKLPDSAVFKFDGEFPLVLELDFGLIFFGHFKRSAPASQPLSATMREADRKKHIFQNGQVSSQYVAG